MTEVSVLLVLVVVLNFFAKRKFWIRLREDILHDILVTTDYNIDTYHSYVRLIHPIFSVPGGYAGDIFGRFNIILVGFSITALIEGCNVFIASKYINLPIHLSILITNILVSATEDFLIGSLFALLGDQMPFPKKYVKFERMVIFVEYTENLINTVQQILLYLVIDSSNLVLRFSIFAAMPIINFAIILLSKNILVISAKAPKNTLCKMISCIWYAKKQTQGQDYRGKDWLALAAPKYDKQMVIDIKRLTCTIVLIPIMCCSVFYKATLEITQHNYVLFKIYLGKIYIEYYIMILFLDFVSLFTLPLICGQLLPMLKRHKIITTHLQIIGLGAFFHIVAVFWVMLAFKKVETPTGLVSLKVTAHVRIYNTLDCDLEIFCPRLGHFVVDSKSTYYKTKELESKVLRAPFKYRCSNTNETYQENIFELERGKHWGAYFDRTNNKVTIFEDNIHESKLHEPQVRTYVMTTSNVNIKYECELHKKKKTIITKHQEKFLEVDDNGPCKIYINGNVTEYQFERGGIYVALVTNGPKIDIFTSVPPNNVNVGWLLPFFFFYSFGDTLLNIYIPVFLYKQAPMKLKATVLSFVAMKHFLSASLKKLLLLIFRHYSISGKLWWICKIDAAGLVVFWICNNFYTYADTELDEDVFSEEAV